MTRIVGLQGLFNGNILHLMLKSLKSNFKSFKKDDISGIFLLSDNSYIYNDKFCNISSKDDYNLGIGSNYSDRFKINESQPIRYKNIVLAFDGIIYNINELNNLLDSNINNNYINHINNINNNYTNISFTKDHLNENENKNLNQGLLLSKIIYKFLQEHSNLKEAIIKSIKIIDGEYSFAVFDGENLGIVRDSIGIKPLYYHINNNSFNSFSSEKKALWKIGIKDSEIKSLKPGYILYNWDLIPPKNNPWDIDYNLYNGNKDNYYNKNNHYNKNNNNNNNYNNNTNHYNKNNDFNVKNHLNQINISKNQDNKLKYLDINKMSYDEIKYSLINLLTDSTYKRILNTDKVGLIFSGGVDSTILATLLKNISDDISVNLYTVGVESSEDLKYAKKVAKSLDFPIKTTIIDETLVRESLNPVLDAIEEPNLMKIGVGMTLYLATKMASNDGISVTLAGQGADELFGGYYKYLTTFKEKGPEFAQESMIHDIEYGYDVNFERDDKIATFNGVDLRVPYLDEKLVNFALKIPIKYKINSDEDLLRKRILRDIAIDIGIDKEIAERPKKAAQYGSGIHKILIKKVLKDIDLNKKIDEIRNVYLNNK
ncbi:asparagine synthase family protein [Methanobrevibacter arboriphilus]|nr:asparagine synthetase B [Methanobrevibacter arboriphilus]